MSHLWGKYLSKLLHSDRHSTDNTELVLKVSQIMAAVLWLDFCFDLVWVWVFFTDVKLYDQAH